MKILTHTNNGLFLYYLAVLQLLCIIKRFCKLILSDIVSVIVNIAVGPGTRSHPAYIFVIKATCTFVFA